MNRTPIRENLLDVLAGPDVFTTEPGEVFDNHHVDFPLGDVAHHLLESGAVKADAADSVVDILINDIVALLVCIVG